MSYRHPAFPYKRVSYWRREKKKKTQSSPFLSYSFFIFYFFLIHKFYANWNMVELLQKISFYNYKNQQLSSSKGEKICYFCGSTKHVSSDCPLYAWMTTTATTRKKDVMIISFSYLFIRFIWCSALVFSPWGFYFILCYSTF